ncbi:MAG: cadmium-translocating P-type ATPase [Clostridiales bacterium]|nr:cadmium-translocating P-type ATPase [Clostridiales bacterium]
MGKHVAPPKNKHVKVRETQKRSLPDLRELIKSVLNIDLKTLGIEKVQRRRHERGFTAPEVIQIAASSVLMMLVWLIPTAGWLRVLSFAAVVIFAGFPIILDAAESVINGELLESDVLMTLGAVVAFCLGEYPTAIFIMIIHRVALAVEAYALSEKQRYLDNILSVLPREACVETAEGTEHTSPESVNVGEILVVSPGEKIPLDGVVTEGMSALDTSPLTAETAPRTVAPGSVAVSGCINLTNTLKIRVMRPFAESTVRCALDMISTEGKKRSDTEKQAFGAARLITPVVLFLGLLIALIPPIVSGGWKEWIGRGILFVCLSGSVSLTASVPLSFLGGLGSAARWGIFANGGACLEKLSKAETFVFDKTGAITEGRFTVTDVEPVRISEKELLAIAAAAESRSSHPIAQALRLACEGELPEEDENLQIEEIPGRGVSAFIGGKHVYVGNSMLLTDHDIDFSAPSRSGTVIHVAVDGVYAGHIILTDKVKEGAFDAIEGLRANGVTNAIMFTGDVRSVARSVAASLNFDMVRPELTPKAKISAVEYLMATKGSGTSLAFVCAGNSDLPAMERADVGIAMGALRYGNALAMADVSVMGDDIRRLPLALRISRAVRRTSLNIILVSLAVKAALLLLGALGIMSIWLAMLCELIVLCYTVFLSLRTFNL